MKTITELLGQDWADFLPKAEQVLAPIREQLQGEHKVGYLIHPAKENVFRIFREMSPQGVKVIWLGQDPYGAPAGQATGRAFECGKYPSPSWRKISEVYRREVKDYDPQVSSGNLTKWADQGVFLLNKALTVRHQMPNSHTKLWEPFTRYVISALINDITHPKAIILLGQEAQRLVPKQVSPHKIFAYEHPAASAYQGRPWKADGLFTDTKKFINFHELDLNW
jgi:uracil-DNA glycosylase